MHILKCLLVFCMIYITVAKAKYYGAEYQELKCPTNSNQLCPVYKIYELGSNNNAFKLDFANYQNRLGKNFNPYEIIVSGSFVDGYFQMDQVFRMMVHPGRAFEYSNNDKFYTIKNDTIIQLNSDINKIGIESMFNTYKDDIPFFHNEWLNLKLSSGDSVYTTISNHIDNGAGQVQVDYVWVSIPDVPKCLKQNDGCQFPFILQPTYERDANRCLIFKGCVRILKNPFCILETDIKGCPAGYKKVSFSNKDGCSKNYCDPSFL
ncbi:hypothetical protein DICPUDRAFT_58924 [Dictyostelium purpureum]|uniref:Uncharacterized protein n=1 Tax=Dictyostelium purpureum TaxID=5786 RepID=F1A3K3_DICPU|nr:uncharacterized protein DICPUDRAFT_58924 [Dictyostelium purpureum]EGC29228.1 hypothetical protein DICPUDRAFT_58924 [Dictyostelium purpureum]|eukprot:XP_003294250.1 hypothetical protein DICPUDRAFT_58924 [Dictyostelium purpureum]